VKVSSEVSVEWRRRMRPAERWETEGSEDWSRREESMMLTFEVSVEGRTLKRTTCSTVEKVDMMPEATVESRVRW
jgi:hypothetical protein